MTFSAITVYTDGSCLRNPGFGGYAYIIQYTVEGSNPDIPEFKEVVGSQGYRLTTNSRMELTAGIEAINKVIELVKDGTIKNANQVNLYSDSEYFVKAINNKWIDKWQENNWMSSGFGNKKPSPIKNKDLWEKVIEFQKTARDAGLILTFNNVLGHSGNELNERCDELAKAAANSNNYLPDTEFEKSQGIN